MSEMETTVTNETGTTGTAPGQEQNTEETRDDGAETARLKAELAKLKIAFDKAAKDAGDAKKALRAKQTAEEAAAEEVKTRQEEMEKELAELKKEKAVATASKRVFTFVNDEKASNAIAEALYGAADVDLAVDEIAKAWIAREKALKAEYGKVPPPGVGSQDGPTVTKAQFEQMGYRDRLEFHNKHPEEYARLTGRATP